MDVFPPGADSAAELLPRAPDGRTSDDGHGSGGDRTRWWYVSTRAIRLAAGLARFPDHDQHSTDGVRVRGHGGDCDLSVASPENGKSLSPGGSDAQMAE